MEEYFKILKKCGYDNGFLNGLNSVETLLEYLESDYSFFVDLNIRKGIDIIQLIKNEQRTNKIKSLLNGRIL